MVTAEKRYQELSMDRQCFLNRAWDAAELTIPFILPRNDVANTDLPTPFQGIGARGVNNLAAKLLLTLFPPNSPFFKLHIDDFTLEQLEQERAPVEEGLGSIERTTMDTIEAASMRVPLYEALRHLIITGNSLVFVDKKNKLRVFHLDQFVMKRDPQGELLEAIVEESISPTLFQEIFKKAPPKDSRRDAKGEKKNLKLHTVIKRVNGKIKTHQEVNGKRIPKTESSYPEDKSPWLALRFSSIDGEDYGRGFVEEYLGDLRSLEGLSQAILEGSAAAAKVLFMVKPNGTTRMGVLASAPNLAVVQGNADDVSTLQMEKSHDFRVAQESSGVIERRLAAAFLLNQSVQRDAERVTAEEIRFLANELETSLGGIYSLQSHELQLPLIKRIMANLEAASKLPVLPKDTVQPTIITGFEALGRGNDANKLATYLKTVADVLGPEVVGTYVNLSDALSRLGTGFGIDMKGLIKSADQVSQEQHQQQQQALLSQAAVAGVPNAINNAGEAQRAEQQTQ